MCDRIACLTIPSGAPLGQPVYLLNPILQCSHLYTPAAGGGCPPAGTPVTVINYNFSGTPNKTQAKQPSGWTFQPASDGANYKFGDGVGFEFGAGKGIFDIVSQTVNVSKDCPYFVKFTLTVPDKPSTFQPFVDAKNLTSIFGQQLGEVNAPAGVYFETGLFHAASNTATIAIGGFIGQAYLFLTNVVIYSI